MPNLNLMLAFLTTQIMTMMDGVMEGDVLSVLVLLTIAVGVSLLSVWLLNTAPVVLAILVLLLIAALIWSVVGTMPIITVFMIVAGALSLAFSCKRFLPDMESNEVLLRIRNRFHA